MEKSFLDYDVGYREGVFDKCNGSEASYSRLDIESDPFYGGYFDGFDSNEVVIPKRTELPISLWNQLWAKPCTSLIRNATARSKGCFGTTANVSRYGAAMTLAGVTNILAP